MDHSDIRRLGPRLSPRRRASCPCPIGGVRCLGSRVGPLGIAAQQPRASPRVSRSLCAFYPSLAAVLLSGRDLARRARLCVHDDHARELFVAYNRTGELGGALVRVDALGAPGWSRSYGSEHIHAVTAAPIGVAVLLMGELDTRVELLDADGELIWESEVMSSATDLEFGPAPAMNLAVGASGRRIEMFDSESGQLSWSSAALEDMDYWSNGMAFIGQEQLVLLDVHVDLYTSKFDAIISAHGQGGQLWGETYNRAARWCPDNSDPNSTAETFLDVTTLDDGSVLVAGFEAFMEGAQGFRQGWVGHVSAQGELLGFDRRLWNGVPIASAAGSDDSGLVLSSELSDAGDEVGFSLRKYTF